MRIRSNPYLARFLIASSLALGTYSVAEAQPMERGPAQIHQMRDGAERGLRRLDLSEAQRDQVSKIFSEQAPAIRERMKAALEARQELRKLSLAPSFDRARAQALANDEARAMADIALMRAESRSRVFALLTPEQRTKLEQLRERGQRRERG
jgi:protein CpxP